MAEWLRRFPAKELCSACEGSNPFNVARLRWLSGKSICLVSKRSSVRTRYEASFIKDGKKNILGLLLFLPSKEIIALRLIPQVHPFLRKSGQCGRVVKAKDLKSFPVRVAGSNPVTVDFLLELS